MLRLLSHSATLATWQFVCLIFFLASKLLKTIPQVLSKCDYDGVVAHIFCLRSLPTLYKKDNCRFNIFFCFMMRK
ncbi:hypothetical protein Ccrd_020014 [Cynara cardunculus var. scolymus]|uniref:Uncharacterized protein n=1 Tax=Cynara cardunculus var. scolymus TaxID=59895 RepID=A0A103Y313_CYNCS|nr:hypothetical protein Ccrd_020131 [Cynara cardunculus var. scolymus]KVI01706.1 hypothetical protein Ccrd_020014 [Cynara cardunculus var. scolymus]